MDTPQTVDVASTTSLALPSCLRSAAGPGRLTAGIAAQIQELDDAVLLGGELLRSLNPTPIAYDVIKYVSSTPLTVGTPVSGVPTIWVVEIGSPAIGVTLTQDTTGATGIVASHIYDSGIGAIRIELISVTGVWVAGYSYTGPNTTGNVTSYASPATATVSEIISQSTGSGVCRLSGITGTFNAGGLAVFSVVGINGLATFNGTTSKVDFPSFNKPLTWSVNCWLTPSIKTTNQIAWALGTTYLVRDTGTTNWLLVSGFNIRSACSITNNIRTMVTISYDGSSMRCYKDGILVSGPTAVTIAAATDVGSFGAAFGGSWYEGSLDEVVMWNREVTAGETVSLYNSGAGTETLSGSLSSGAIHQWHLNSDANDSIGTTHGTSTDVGYGSYASGNFTSKLYSIDNKWIESVGDIVGFERGQEPDDVALRYLQGQMDANVSWGRIEDVRLVVGALFGSDNVYIDDGGETQSATSGFGTSSHGPMTITVGPENVVTVTEVDYQRSLTQLKSAKPAGVAMYVAAHRTETGLGSPFRFGLPQVALTSAPNVDTDILWDLVGFTNNMTTGRYYHTATKLLDGRVLIVGGIGPSTAATATCEIYNVSSGTWASTGPMSTARYYHRAILLASGKVLVVGGTNGAASLATCEIFDPTTNTWTSTGPMGTARATATAILPNGNIIACGGFGTVALATCEIYDVLTGTWSTTGNMGTARYYHAATALASGQILASGGTGLASTETYDPTLSIWTAAGAMTSARYHHTATLLSTGKVLIIDGSSSSTSCNLFDPVPRTCSATGSLPSAQTRHAVSLLADGNVLIAGGVGTGNCNKYTVSTGTWEIVDSLNSPRNGATATLMATGVVLIAGGFYSTPQVTCEIYSPTISGERCAVFNGTTSLITTPALGPSGASARSMGCAFYQPIPTPAQIFLGYGVASAGQAFQFRVEGGIINVDIHGTTYPFGTCVAGEWHYFCATYDGTTLRGYLDGVQGTPVTVTLATAATGPLEIGGGPSMDGFTRCISNVHIHNRALTESQVQILYNNGVGPDYNHLNGAGEGMVHYFPLTGGSSVDAANMFPDYPIVGKTLTQTSPAATGVIHSYIPTGPSVGFAELDTTNVWSVSSPYTWQYGSGTITAVGHTGSHFDDANPTLVDTFMAIEIV